MWEPSGGMGSWMRSRVLRFPGSPSAWKSWLQVIFGTIAWPGFKNVLGWFLEETRACEPSARARHRGVSWGWVGSTRSTREGEPGGSGGVPGAPRWDQDSCCTDGGRMLLFSPHESQICRPPFREGFPGRRPELQALGCLPGWTCRSCLASLPSP